MSIKARVKRLEEASDIHHEPIIFLTVFETETGDFGGATAGTWLPENGFVKFRSRRGESQGEFKRRVREAQRK